MAVYLFRDPAKTDFVVNLDVVMYLELPLDAEVVTAHFSDAKLTMTFETPTLAKQAFDEMRERMSRRR
jgi:hypothetical protein